MNIESERASEHLRALLIKENPLWKLPDRRVARYLKRHLKARKSPLADDIEADMDESTVYTTMSTQTSTRDIENIPSILNDQSIPEDEVEEIKVEEIEGEDVGGENANQNKNLGDNVEDEGIEAIVERDDDAGAGFEFTEEDYNAEIDKKINEAYTNDNDENGKDDDGLKCFGMSCVIS